MNTAAMRRFYDRTYYRFEGWLNMVIMDAYCRRSLRGYKPDKAFWDNFRNNVRPYWAQFGIRVSPLWFKHYYKLNGALDPRYIPDDIHLRRIIPYFDKDMYIRPLVDKNLHSLMFPQVKRPETVFKHIDGRFTEDNFISITREEAMTRCLAPGRYIVKPTVDTGQGRNIRFFSGEDGQEAAEEVLASFEGIDYIVQKLVRQHPALARYNPTCLNTVRIVTMYLNGKAHILSTILRIGADGNEVDNFSQGGYQCTIRPDGSVEKLAYAHRPGNDMFVEQTSSGMRFEDLTIPCWDKVRDTALHLSEYMPHLKFIGWDLAINEDGEIVLIEFNCQMAQNQGTCGPTFGDLTDEVLTAVFGKQDKKS